MKRKTKRKMERKTKRKTTRKTKNLQRYRVLPCFANPEAKTDEGQSREKGIRAEPSQRAGGHVPGGWKVAATKSLRRATGQKKRRHKAPGWRPTQRGGDQYRGGEG